MSARSPVVTNTVSAVEPKPSTSKAADASVIEICDSSDSDEGVSSDVDSDFIDVPDPNDISGGFSLTPVISLEMNKPPWVDMSKDFRLCDLKTIEVVVKRDEMLKEEDDMFADVFTASNVPGRKEDTSVQATVKVEKPDAAYKESSKEKKIDNMKNILNDLDVEMAAVTNINLDSILPSETLAHPDGGIASVLKKGLITDADAVSINDLETEPDSSNDYIKDAEDDVEEMKIAEEGPIEIKSKDENCPSVSVSAPTTPAKMPSTPSKSISSVNEETPPKVPQPFFVKRTPPSKRKAGSNTAESPSKVAKSLFEADAPKPVFDERAAIETAANLLKETKSKDELETIASKLHTNRAEMQMEMNKRDRLGVSITDRMTQECMDLLRLFGIPYVVAPMEAEAQCAYLNQIELTDGTITDDSDIWLFGGETVYKNFFDQTKYVLEFRSGNIERLFHVDRKKMIQMSFLVGSDYTPGL